jgi:hypothetical protein
MVMGSRFLSGATLAGGMPVYKYVSNRLLTSVENLVLRQRLSECHTGFRAYSRSLLETIPFLLNSDNFGSSVVYGLGTLQVMARYLLDRWRLRPSPQYRQQLRQVRSRYHAEEILKERPS